MSRELDKLIDQRIMGACVTHQWETTSGGLGGQYLSVDTYCAVCSRERGVYSTPAYSADLNACRRAEEKIVELGLGNVYAQTLTATIRADLWASTGTEAGAAAATITAPAEIRCRAMLRVMEGQG